MAQTLNIQPTVNRRRHRMSAIGLAAALLIHSHAALANPNGMNVVSGSVTSSQTGSTLTLISKGGAAVIDWKSFSIQSGERTHFSTGSAFGRVLNRVVGIDPTVINGALSSDGSIFIINRNGIAVGRGGVIDTAALVMSTLDVDNDAFMNRQELTFSGSGAGITNNGSISADRSISLIGSGVNNAGSIRSQGGDITLAAGDRVSISGTGFDNVFIEVPRDASQVSNTGSLWTNTGQIGLLAAVQVNTGATHAARLVLDDDGNVEITNEPETPVNNPDPEGEQPGGVDPDPEVGEPVGGVNPDPEGEEPVPGIDPENPETPDTQNPTAGPVDPVDRPVGECGTAVACEPSPGSGQEQPDPNGVDPSPTSVVDGPTEGAGSPAPIANGGEPFAPSPDGEATSEITPEATRETPISSTPSEPQSPTFIVDPDPANLNALVASTATQNATALGHLQNALENSAHHKQNIQTNQATATSDTDTGTGTDIEDIAGLASDEIPEADHTVWQCKII